MVKLWKNISRIYLSQHFLIDVLTGNITKGLNTLLKIKKNNKPVIFISGHFSNFELMAMEITKKKIDLATIYRPLNNIFLNNEGR